MVPAVSTDDLAATSHLTRNTCFREFSPVLGVKINRGWKVFRLYFKIVIRSATSVESSHRDLLNYMAEHRSILKNNQNTHYSLIFQDRPMLSHVNEKLSPRPFYSFFTSPYLPLILEVERTSRALNVDDVR